MSDQDAPHTAPLRGHVTAVRGTVVDVWFENGLPPIDAALDCELDDDWLGDRGGPFASGQFVRAGDRDRQHAWNAAGCDGDLRGLAACEFRSVTQLVGRVIDLRGATAGRRRGVVVG